jgi:hypothetical protein
MSVLIGHKMEDTTYGFATNVHNNLSRMHIILWNCSEIPNGFLFYTKIQLRGYHVNAINLKPRIIFWNSYIVYFNQSIPFHKPTTRPTYTIVYSIITPTYFETDVFSSGSFYIKF